MTIQVIVWIILALIVLIVLVIAFRGQLSELFKGFTQLISGTVENTQSVNISSIGG
ncbi:MAG: hypothetical protein ISS82_02870 [Nanoarchaeota archaeon]|nr:hypothetical protein [Nanoarchaeota archaeon]